MRRPPDVQRGSLRVLALVSDAPGGHGGIATYNAELLGALAAAPGGCRATVLPRVDPKAATVIPGVQVLPALRSRAAYVARALQLGLGASYQWLFCGHLHLLPLARVVAALSGARLWLQVHGIEAWQAPGPRIRAATARADLVTAVSRHTRRRLLDWATLHPARVRVLNNTCGPPFGPGEPDHGVRQQLAPRGESVILTVARLDARERYKGHDQVIRALASPPLRATPAPVYAVVGDGDDRSRLEALARELGVAERVHFLGDVGRERLPALYRSADVFAMPSRGEGFGIVFLEAAACGVPVIGGDRDGTRDALRDGRVGTLVDASDPHAVAGAIARALEHPEPPQGHEVFGRDLFRRRLLALLADCPPITAAERWR